MNLKTLLLTGFTCVTLTACTLTPPIPQMESGVLQEVQNLDMYPNMTNSKAKLTKFSDKCVIEFTANINDGKVIEQWTFSGNTLMSGGAAVFAQDGTSKARKFDLNNAGVQQNYMKLRNYFAKDAIGQCN